MRPSPLLAMAVHFDDPEFAAATSHAIWSRALPGPYGRHLAFGQAEPAPVKPLPAFVGASINQFNQPYYHVLEEYRGAVALALNNYTFVAGSDRPATAGMGTIIAAKRVGGVGGDLVPQIQQQLSGRAIGLIGDPLVDSELGILLGYSLPQLSRLATESPPGTNIPPGSAWYVLSPPETGWAPEPTLDQGEIARIINQMSAGLRWGSIVGAAAALGIIGYHQFRARRTS